MTELIERPVDEAELKRNAERVRAGFWPKLRRVVRHIPFTDDLLAAYYCARDPKTPSYVKAVLMGAIAYFVVPTDMVPDFIAGLGFTDDATVLLTAVSTVGNAIRDEHREKAKDALAEVSGPDPIPGPAPAD